ncbi:tripartite tricarboxylate transporter substrate binding protein [Falsiroseomonas sp.]|uniref:Bug family tripartite tricarboxylate transporter substrate binding protein n=1 Tax=Falsiroseomonas sp. TaxID=2870721 RepID=UPI002732D2DE|nr:tripartite tricarboxylate transporter substrate binding protein [Falsiroseomonas sp.]MDP3418692.1 tripartite tricarboxylate transporter substrate binding protein [Falsiroseomonas sp.]
MLGRRSLLATTGAVLASPALSQGNFPTRPIRFVVPWPPGGATSNISRIVGDAMSPLLGQPVVLDHRAGAGGAIGTADAARSAPDGYNILMAGAGTFYRPLIEREVPFNPDRDFGFIGLVGDGPFALVLRNGLPNSLRGFIDYARANPGRLNFASSGQGSTSHLTAEAFNTAAGIEAAHVAYRGSAPAMNDLLGGRVDYYFDAFATVLENARAGRIQAIGVTTSARASRAPELPTLEEAGMPGFTAAPWWGIIGPAGMPAQAIQRLSAALAGALGQREVVDRLAEQGCRAVSMEPAPFEAFVRAENEKWSQVIERAGLRVS